MATLSSCRLLVLVLLSSQMIWSTSAKASCKRGGAFGFKKIGDCKCDDVWGCFINKNRICGQSVECDAKAVADAGASRLNINVRFDIKNLIATNKFLSDMFGGFTDMSDSIKTKITETVGCTGPDMAVRALQDFDTTYFMLAGRLSVTFNLKVFSAVADVFTEYNLDQVIVDTVRDAGYIVDTATIKHTVTKEPTEDNSQAPTTEAPTEPSNPCANETHVDGASTVSFEVGFTVIGIKITEAGLFTARKAYSELEGNLKKQLSDILGCTGDQMALSSFANYDSCFGPSNMVVSFTLEVLTTSTGAQVKSQVENKITNLVMQSGFTIKEITIDQEELSCSASENVDLEYEYETRDISCTIENAPDDLAQFYESVASLDMALQKEIRTALGCQGSLPTVVYLGDFDMMPNKVSHTIEISFSLYLVKSANYTLDESIIKTKVQSMIFNKTGLNIASFSFEVQKIVVEEYVEGDEVIEELPCEAISNQTDALEHSSVRTSFKLMNIDLDSPRFKTGYKGSMALLKSGIKRKLRDELGCQDGRQAMNEIAEFEESLDKEARTVNITVTFDVYTSRNSSSNVTIVNDDTLQAIQNAVEGALQEMDITYDNTSFEIEVSAIAESEKDVCEATGNNEALVLHQIDLSLTLEGVDVTGGGKMSVSHVLTSFREDLIIAFDSALGCAGTKHSLKKIEAVNYGGSIMNMKVFLEYKLYIYTLASNTEISTLKETVINVTTTTVKERFSIILDIFTMNEMVVDDFEDDKNTDGKDTCEGDGNDEDLTLNEFHLTLSLEGFTSGFSMGFSSFSDVLISFKADLMFEFEKALGCAGSKRALKKIDAVNYGGSFMSGSGVLEYVIYIYTTANDTVLASLNETVTSIITTAVEEKLEVTLESLSISVTIVDDFEDDGKSGSKDRCEGDGNDEDLTLNEFHLTLSLEGFTSGISMGFSSFSDVLISFKADLMFEFEKALGCAGSKRALKKIDAVNYGGSFMSGSGVLEYVIYIYTTANDTVLASLNETVTSIITTAVEEKLEVTLESLSISVTIVDDFEDDGKSGSKDRCEGDGNDEDLTLNEFHLTLSLEGFTSGISMGFSSFSDVLISFKADLMFEFEKALGCAGSKRALKKIDAVNYGGSFMSGSGVLEYVIYIYTTANDTVLASLNETVTSIITTAVEEKLEVTLESLSISVTIVDDFEDDGKSGSKDRCEGDGNDEDLTLNEFHLTLSLEGFTSGISMGFSSFSDVLISFKADLMFEFEKALGCAGSKRALKKIDAVNYGGSFMSGSGVLEYVIYIYTTANDTVLASLNETVTSIITTAVEEKLEVTLESLSISVTIVDDFEDDGKSGSKDRCEGDGNDEDLTLNEFHLTLSLEGFTSGFSMGFSSFSDVMISFKADLMFEFEKALGCAGSKRALKKIDAVNYGGSFMSGSGVLEYVIYIYTTANDTVLASLNETVTSIITTAVEEKLEVTLESLSISVTIVDDFEDDGKSGSKDRCEGDGNDEDLTLNEFHLTLSLEGFTSGISMGFSSFSDVMISFKADLMFEFEKALGCAGSKRALKKIDAVNYGGSFMSGSGVLEYVIYIYTTANDTVLASLNETVTSIITTAVEEKLEVTLESLSISVTIVDDFEDDGKSGSKDRCEGDGNDEDLTLNEFHLTLSLEGFTSGFSMGFSSFSDVLISFKADLMFEFEKALGCAGSKRALKKIDAVNYGGSFMSGSGVLEYVIYIYTTANDTVLASLNETVTSIITTAVEEKLEVTLESLSISVTIVDDFEDDGKSGSKDRCEGDGNDEDLTLNEFHLTLSLEGFTSGISMGFSSFSDVMISFKADLMFEFEKALGCAGSKRALKKIDAVNYGGSFMSGSGVLEYVIYIYTTANDTVLASLNETVTSIITTAVEEKLEVTLESLSISVTIVDDFEDDGKSGSKDRCEGDGNDEDLTLNEFHLTLSLEGFTSGFSMGFSSFSDVLISFKADLMFEFEKALGCAGSKRALKKIDAVNYGGSFMSGSGVLEYVIYIYTTANDTVLASLNETVTSIITTAVEEKLEVTLESLSISVTLVDDFDYEEKSGMEDKCEGSGTDEELTLHEFHVALSLQGFKGRFSTGFSSFSDVLFSFKADLMFEFEKALGCAGSKHALKKIDAINYGGNFMKGSGTLEYVVYIYTAGNEGQSTSLNETVNTIITTAVEEKLEVTLESLTLTVMIIDDFDDDEKSGGKDACDESGDVEGLVLHEFYLTLALDGFTFGRRRGPSSFQDVLISFKADLTFEFEKIFGCSLKEIVAVNYRGNVMRGRGRFEYKLYILTSANESESASLNETISTVITTAVEEKLEVTLLGLTMTVTIVSDAEDGDEAAGQDSCEGKDDNEELILHKFSLSLSLEGFTSISSMGPMSFSDVLISFKADLVYEFEKALGCAGSKHALKKIEAVNYGASVLEGTVVLEYTLYIYTSANESGSTSLNDKVTNVITIAVEEKLEVTLESISINASIAEDFEADMEQGEEDICAGNGDDQDLVLNEIDLTVSLEGFSFNGSAVSVSFHDILISFKADLEFEFEKSLECAGSKNALKLIDAIDYSGSMMSGTVVLKYKLYLYTVVNDSSSTSLNDVVNSLLTIAVQEKLGVSLISISINITIIDDFEDVEDSGEQDICEGNPDDDELVLHKVTLSLSLTGFDFSQPMIGKYFKNVLTSFKADLMFELENVLGCAGSEHALNEIEAIRFSGNRNASTLILEYELYIYTVGHHNGSGSLQDTITSVVNSTVEEKLGVTLLSITITMTMVDDADDESDSGSSEVCEDSGDNKDMILREVSLTIEVSDFAFIGRFSRMPFRGLLHFFSREFKTELDRLLGCAGSQRSLKDIIADQARGDKMSGKLQLEFTLFVYSMLDEADSMFLNDTINTAIINVIEVKFEAQVQSMLISVVSVEVVLPGAEDGDLDCTSRDDEMTEDLVIEISFTLIETNFSNPDTVLTFSAEFSLFQTTITNNFRSLLGCAGSTEAFQGLSEFNSLYNTNLDTVDISFELMVQVTTNMTLNVVKIKRTLMFVLMETSWQVNTSSVLIKETGPADNETDSRSDTSSSTDESTSETGSGEDGPLVCTDDDNDLETKRLSVMVSFTVTNIDFLGPNLVGVLASINLLEEAFFMEIRNAMGCHGDQPAVTALEEYQAIPDVVNGSVEISFRLIVLSVTTSSFDKQLLRVVINNTIINNALEFNSASLTIRVRLITDATDEPPTTADPDNPVCRPKKIDWKLTFVFRTRVRLFGVNYVFELSDQSSDVYKQYIASIIDALSHRLGCMSKKLKGQVQAITNVTFTFGSVIAEFDLGTSTNNITDNDIKDDVNEQLTVMGMEPDPTETYTELKQAPSAAPLDEVALTATWVIATAVVGCMLIIMIVVIAIWRCRLSNNKKQYPKADYGIQRNNDIYASNNVLYWRNKTPSYLETDESAYDLQRNSVIGLAPAVSMDAPSDWKIPSMSGRRLLTRTNQQAAGPVTYDGFYYP